MAANVLDLVNIRTVEVNDVNFILSSVSKSALGYSKDIWRAWTPVNIHNFFEKMIICALNKLNYSLLIACDRNDSNLIFAFLMADPKKNHILFQYTKYSYRKLGIQRDLLIPLLIDKDRQVSVQYGTAEIQKLAEANKLTVKDVFTETLMEKLEDENIES